MKDCNCKIKYNNGGKTNPYGEPYSPSNAVHNVSSNSTFTLSDGSNQYNSNINVTGADPEYVKKPLFQRMFSKDNVRSLDMSRSSDRKSLEKEAIYAGFKNSTDYMTSKGFSLIQGQWYPSKNQETNVKMNGTNTVTNTSDQYNALKQTVKNNKVNETIQVGPMMKWGGKLKFNNGGGISGTLAGSNVSYGSSGVNANISPSLNFGNKGATTLGLNLGTDNDNNLTRGIQGNLNFGPTRGRDWDPRFVGSLSGNIGINKKRTGDGLFKGNTGTSASGRVSLGFGRPGVVSRGGCSNGMCFTNVPGYNLNAFFESSNKKSFNPGNKVGLSGQYGNFNAEGSYNLDTKSPNFKVGVGIPFNRFR